MRVPSLRKKHNRGVDVAVVTLSQGHRRRDFYCGRWGTQQARQRYADLIGAWESAGRKWPSSVAADGVTVVEIVASFKRFAQTNYGRGELDCLKSAWMPLVEVAGELEAAAFGPIKLREVRAAMVKRGWNRSFVNHQVRRVRSIFKWSASNELLPVTVYQALQTIEPLKAGKTSAPEPEPIQPVAAEHVEAIRPHVDPDVWSIILLQRLTGARPGEILALRPGDVDKTGAVWRAELSSHKTAHRGKTRSIYFGPQAQIVLRPLLDGTRNDCRVFSGYTVASYRRAIARACVVAGVPHWHPHQLRHTAATEIRKLFGLEAAQQVLGHSSAAITDAVYAQRDRAVVERVIGKFG